MYIMAKNNELEDCYGECVHAFLAKNKAKFAGEANLVLKLLQYLIFTDEEKNLQLWLFLQTESKESFFKSPLIHSLLALRLPYG